ncbi:MAG: hypothetical protein LCH91_22805 [Bacteroidetes bacterium]|nr:hypothetical protein [Bacteroidota bacterium]
MKKALTVLYSTLLFVIPTVGGISTAFAQGSADSVRITHTQEAGTLEKQRFIDRYDYVFMTKEPTKWMLKIDGNFNNLLSSEVFQRGYLKRVIDFRLGIEHKLNSSFSLALDVTRNNISPFTANGLLDYSKIYNSRKHWVTSAELRWYYDMASRIRQGKSSNNFSGNYLSLKYEKAWQNYQSVVTGLIGSNGKWNTDYVSYYYQSQISLNYGIQRRFFRYGLIDFSVALNRNTDHQIHRKLIFLDGDNSVKQPVDWNNIQESITSEPQHNWSINTNFKIGVALADFKKMTKVPACDVFQCLEDESSLWKLHWPRISLSTSTQTFYASIGYEQKIAKSAFSINGYFNFLTSNSAQKNTQMYDDITKTHFFSDYRNSSISSYLYIQPRWYFSMNRQIRMGKSGNNLSGIYTGINNVFWGMYSISKNERSRNIIKYPPTFINTGLLLGYQRKLFKNGFIDLCITRGLLDKEPYVLGRSNFILDFKLGFAL